MFVGGRRYQKLTKAPSTGFAVNCQLPLTRVPVYTVVSVPLSEFDPVFINMYATSHPVQICGSVPEYRDIITFPTSPLFS